MRFLLIILAVLLAFGGYSWVWFDKADELEQKLASSLNTTSAGVTTSFESLEVSGYPYRLEAEIIAPSIRLSDPMGQITIIADRMTVHSRPYTNDHLIITTDQNPAFKVSAANSNQTLLSLSPTDLSASIVQDEGGMRLAIDANQTSVTIPNLPDQFLHNVQYHQRMGTNGPEFRLILSHNEGDDQGIEIQGPTGINTDGGDVFFALDQVRARYAGPLMKGPGRLILQPAQKAGVEILTSISLDGWIAQCPAEVQAALRAIDATDGNQDNMAEVVAKVGLDGITAGPARLKGTSCSAAN